METRRGRMETRRVLVLVRAMAWALLVGSAAGRPSLFLEEMISGIAEAPASPDPRTGVTFAEASLKEQVLLVITNVFSIMLSLCPYIIWVSTGSWSTTRNIFPAKFVVCNLGGAFMWAIYMNIQMYLSYGYAGLDAVVINCLTMTLNIIVLLMYFQNAKEYLKFGICLVMSLGFASSFTGLLVFHPYSAILPGETIQKLMYWSNAAATYGIGFFGILNVLPFHDLWKISRGGQRDIVTLRWPMLLCTFYNCFVSFLWTTYAWIFSSSNPNYFMIANLIAAILSLIQTFWLGVICLHYRKVEGHISDSESFRSSLFKLAKTLDKMALVPVGSGAWKSIGKFESFLEYVLLGKQSLSHINLALQQEMVLLEEKMAAAVVRQLELKDEATATADHADLIVATATNAVSQGLAAANAAQLAVQHTSALNARQTASTAVLAFLQTPEGRELDQGIEEIPPVAAANTGQGNRGTVALTLSRDLQQQADIAVGVSSSQAVAVAKAAATESDAHASMRSCSDLFEACNLGVSAFDAISRAVTNKLADAQEQEVLQPADAQLLQDARILALRSAIRDASPHIKFIANRVRSSLQVINATIGVPATLREALRQSQEQMLVLKTAADSVFFGRRLKKALLKLVCKGCAGDA